MELTKRQLIAKWANGELKEGQVWERTDKLPNAEIVVTKDALFRQHNNLTICCDVPFDNATWQLKEWQPCTWLEAMEAKAECKTVKVVLNYGEAKERIYENSTLIDQIGGTITIQEIQQGQWYKKMEG